MSALLGAALLAGASAAPRPAVALLLGEALIAQSSGRHRPQPALLLAVDGPLRDLGGGVTLGLGGDLLLTTAADRGAIVSLDQHVARAALLATATFSRPATSFRVETRRGPVDRASPGLAFELAVGPAANVTAAVWSAPEFEPIVLGEPGARGRAGLAVSLGPRLALRGQGGLSWRPSGIDHDYLAGVEWAW